MNKTELDWVSAYKKLEVELENKDKRIAELEKENAEYKGLKDVATLIRSNNDTVVTLMQLNNMLVGKNQQLTYAKTIIQDLLDNTDEYARQRAIDFLKEE